MRSSKRAVGYLLQLFLLVIPKHLLLEAMVQTGLPTQLERSMSLGLLVRPRTNMYVLGTVHIGSESADEVEILIETLKPSFVVLEVPPSRVEGIRKKNKRKMNEEGQIISQQMSVTSILRTLAALAEKGWKTGGVGGVVFAVGMLGGSILKKLINSKEESEKIPRKDEFATAIAAGDAVGSNIIAADFEIDEIISDVSRSLSLKNWISLGVNVLAQTFGTQATDPIRRRKGESIEDWAKRRRKVSTAQASKKHGDDTVPELSRVLVENRDIRFADSCLKVLESHDDLSDSPIVVCVVGLVHLDGVVQRLRLQ